VAGSFKTFGTIKGGIVNPGGGLVVLPGGIASAISVKLGVLTVLSGGVVSGTIDNNGADVVSGTASNTRVSNGGIEAVFGPGTSLSATTLSGGVQYALSGGVGSGTTDSAGGADIALAGGRESRTVVSSGGTEVASSGGTLVSATTLSGGIQYVLSSGTASSTTDNGGVDIVLAGGIEIGTKASNGGIEVESSGGTSLSATVLAGGVEYALSGGLASNTIINGGNEQILAGGTATGAIVEGGGILVVSSGGTINGATMSGGTVEIQSGGLTGANPITYTGGAALILDASTNFNGAIAGFTAAGEYLDLRDIAFGSSTSMSFVEAGNNLSGTLTVTDGTHTAHLNLLGSHTPGQFTSASDGHNGTVITDPPDPSSLLWQPEVSLGNSSTVVLRGGELAAGSTVGTWAGAAGLLWQPADDTRGVMAGAFLQNVSAGTLGWVMHPPSLGS